MIRDKTGYASIRVPALVPAMQWTQAAVFRHLASMIGAGPSNDLLRGHISRFSLDALVNIATALGCRVRVKPTAA